MQSQVPQTPSVTTQTDAPTKTYECPNGDIVTDISQCPKTKCTDGTLVGSCSTDKPKYCDQGRLVDMPSVCGCPVGYQESSDGCIQLPTQCSDGTSLGSCSRIKPNYCDLQGNLIENAQICGCPDNLVYDQSSNSCIVYSRPCSDGTAFLACSKFNIGKICNANGVLVDAPMFCGCPPGEVLNGASCSSSNVIQNTNSYSFTSHENSEPYYSAFCEKIDPYDLNVREAASEAIRNDPGSYSISQLFDVYDWVKANIIYQNVALSGVPYSPSQTLATKSGDCKNQAVLIASMVQSIGGTSQVVADPSCSHAYAMVYFGPAGSNTDSFVQAVNAHYGSGVSVRTLTLNGGIWIIFDPAGGVYPGQTLPECTGQRDVYLIKTCMTCANQYSNTPYTYGDKCYSTCPSGTISANQHACKPSPCPDGYVPGEDQMCHLACGNYNTYCTTGTCCNNQCVHCPSGYSLRVDCRCWRD